MGEGYETYRKRRLAQSNLGLEIFALGGVDEDLLKARRRLEASTFKTSPSERTAIETLAADLEALRQRLRGLQRRMSVKRRAAKEAT